MPKQVWALTQTDTSFLIDTAVTLAGELGVSVTVSVVEAGGAVIGLLRMDDAKLPSTHVATSKAWTSAYFQRASGDYSASTAPGGGAYALWNAFPGKLVPVPGGQPLTVDGSCVGAIGVSGGTGEQDDEIAARTASRFAERAH